MKCRKPVVSLDLPLADYPTSFTDDTIGFAVLQTAMDAKRSADAISTLWLRNVNNSLHMIRVVSKLIDYSIHDSMTGLLNRRGMEMMYSRRRKRIAPDDNIIVWVIDMDGLKYINDHFGHESGDIVSSPLRRLSVRYLIRTIYQYVQAVTSS